MINGFKEFISRGSAIDLAVGMIIGAAFTQIVTALTDNVLNPIIGGLFGQPRFDHVGEFTIQLAGDPAVVQPGILINAIINFLLVAIALYFFIVMPMNKWAERTKKAEEETAPEPNPEITLLQEIRDELKAQNSGTQN
ncbi:MAG: large conductance mechanosensitive channel protein MscL [Actinomycetaceae bacterium]|nr:large conductance mechanosensitive channel protein MscL [Actinomycetaceae bacterium]